MGHVPILFPLSLSSLSSLPRNLSFSLLSSPSRPNLCRAAASRRPGHPQTGVTSPSCHEAPPPFAAHRRRETPSKPVRPISVFPSPATIPATFRPQTGPVGFFGDRHENQDRTVEILSRFACHRSGVDADPNQTSYMSNLAILGARNSMKRSVCGIEAPLRKLVFRTRTIEGLELVPDPLGDRQRYLKDLIVWCRYSVGVGV
ncbi:hypothetical protein PanWU01x14_308780 [Parasponia andersonii]|uniref:Uncharacterized protein n=1 Tax=Parasponia andersonii TaxID=3476 RepID=A0A2P5AQZ7_PARAD|nr:hypothetical protein PanWU01x14_308780 [Parasponia andersonii]